jgi:hypothetical protein
MRAAFNAISGLQDEVLKEVDKKPLSEIRRKALLAITEQYEELEQVYMGAYDEADMSFKFAALKVNKQQLEKQILEKGNLYVQGHRVNEGLPPNPWKGPFPKPISRGKGEM